VVDRTLAVNAWEALFRAQVAVMRKLSAEFPSGELSLNEYDVLFNLSRAPERRLRIRDLNKTLLVTQPSVSRMVDRLASRGLVVKSEDPGDGRGTVVGLTDLGFETYRATATIHAASIAHYVGDALDSADLTQLLALCNSLRDSVDHTMISLDAPRDVGGSPAS
jgi:DNA-binding MarR family transcriptional regulator